MIGNGYLVTRDSERPFFENGTMTMDGTVIKKAGTLGETKKEFHDAEYTDVRGNVIMPAFINTCEHIYNAMARGLSIKGYDPEGFLDTPDGMWWTINCHLMGEQTRQSARATYLNSIRNGVTTVLDHHASSGEIKDFLLAIEDAAKEMGVRAYLCYEISDRDDMGKAKVVATENAFRIKHVLVNNTNMAAGMMGVHVQSTISGEAMGLAVVNKPAEARYHIYMVEGIEGLRDCLKKYGEGVMGRLMDYNILREKALPTHCIYINPHEMQLIKDTDTMVVYNPEPNMDNACECPPTMEIMHRGIFTGLGTDDYTHDMTESFRVVNVLHKHHFCDVNAAWGEAPQMLSEGNARIASRYLEKQLGASKEGIAADVIVTDYIPLTLMGVSSIGGHILLGMTKRSMVITVHNDEVLMKDKEPVGLDEGKALYEVREEAKKLAHPINGQRPRQT